MLTAKDEELIGLLRLNAREPVASLARKLGLSRTTVQDRLKRLEDNGAIAGYSVKMGGATPTHVYTAMVMLAVEPRKQIEVGQMISKLPQVESLWSVSGKFDLMAMVGTRTAEEMDQLIDRMNAFAGVNDIETAVILSTKLDRR
jgi:DNA-binding Lrp family transcriptional regulator